MDPKGSAEDAAIIINCIIRTLEKLMVIKVNHQNVGFRDTASCLIRNIYSTVGRSIANISDPR